MTRPLLSSRFWAAYAPSSQIYAPHFLSPVPGEGLRKTPGILLEAFTKTLLILGAVPVLAILVLTGIILNRYGSDIQP